MQVRAALEVSERIIIQMRLNQAALVRSDERENVC